MYGIQIYKQEKCVWVWALGDNGKPELYTTYGDAADALGMFTCRARVRMYV